LIEDWGVCVAALEDRFGFVADKASGREDQHFEHLTQLRRGDWIFV
jgi:hypothetical protein